MAEKVSARKVGKATGAVKKNTGKPAPAMAKAAGRGTGPAMRANRGGAAPALKTAGKALAAAVPADEFREIPLELILIEKQIRTGVSIDDEASQGFVDSIASQGVIEPVVVTPREDRFLLLAGERRCLACRKLGLATIPARVLPDVQSGEEVLTIQLIENLQRQEIDPIDKANAILEFFQNRHEGMDLDGVISALLNYDRDPGRVENEFTATVAVNSNYAGMKTRTIENVLSLLRLPSKIGDAVKAGILPVSQGYILAADLENPGLMDIFAGILENPVTNRRLAELLKRAAQADATPAEGVSPFQSYYAAGRTLTRRLEDGEVSYDLTELENLRLFFQSLIELIEKAEAGGGTAKPREPSPVLRTPSPRRGRSARPAPAMARRSP